MLTVSSMASFCSLGEDCWKKVWHDSFGHVMLLAPVQALNDTDDIVSGTILFVRSRWLKQGETCRWRFLILFCDNLWKCETWLFGHVMPMLQCWHHMTLMASSIAPLHLLFHDDWNEMQYDFFGPLVPLGISTMWCKWHHKWHYCIYQSR